MFLIFDTETTGLPKDYKAPASDHDNWPRVVQLAWQLHSDTGALLSAKSIIIKPEGFTIPYNAVKIHGITTERAEEVGQPLAEVLAAFELDRAKAKYAVGHNVSFDILVLSAEYDRMGLPLVFSEMPELDTKELSTEFCALPNSKGGKFKWPSLMELHQKLFGKGFADAHDAAYDVDATGRCFFGLIKAGQVPLPEITDLQEISYQAPQLDAANFADTSTAEPEELTDIAKTYKVDISDIANLPFAHLHCHSQFSILQSTSSVKELVAKAVELEMPAIALTDHGNMMGAFQFVKEALKAGIKPVLGCEFNLCSDRRNKSVQDNGAQTVILAKNKAGYHNLAKLASIAYTEGFYYVPRIDKESLLKYKEGLIVTTGGIWGEVPNLVLNVGETQAEEAFLWWKEHFGEDFYVELNRHGLPEEDVVNTTMLGYAEKFGVKYFAANNTYYTNKADANTQDMLLCVRDAEQVSKPKKYIGRRGREFRFGLPNDEYYIKPADEMKRLFADLPRAIACVSEMLDKIETYKLERDVLLPKFEIPIEFLDPLDESDGGKRGENAYLRHLTFIGASERYGELDEKTRERLDFELATIERTGYPGYFLIVQDFCAEARRRGVWVGPGRGSAAGSAVAYCTGITNVDPIKYDLLFERFLNPDRVSLPDIDIDFDDEGRQKVIDYVIAKYGANQVAQIITYGSMAAKSSVRDAGRVLNLSLSETDGLAKMVPSVALSELFKLSDTELKNKLRDTELPLAIELKRIANLQGLQADVVQAARKMEGNLRNTGIHACGVIITPGDITDYVPVATAKDSEMWCTQFDNGVVESAGLLKMDFLGLKTLTLIKDAVSIVKQRYGVDIDPDKIDLEDVKTYELFQRGETVGIFQYESPGMQMYLKELKPTRFDDLIAMNALYRPGPMDYIPSFVRRKHGTEPITYDMDASEEFLKETYGITVYQEQVMLLSQKLAGFTKGEADVLRKAMGKKILSLLETLKPKFLDGCEANGHNRTIAEKVWKDWEAFASYAFNKSHSTCYALVAFQTAYLKANYPAAYMASVLSNNMNDIKQVSLFMEECRRMDNRVLGPSVNESQLQFTVDSENRIRFGLGAIKGIGGMAVKAIIQEREANGAFTDIYDFVKRTEKRHVNRRCIENLAQAGALDCFNGIYRSQYFAEMPGSTLTFCDALVKFGSAAGFDKDAPPDLFGSMIEVEVQTPTPPPVQPWDSLTRLNREKQVVGIYISAHPLDSFRLEMKFFSRGDLRVLQDLSQHKDSDFAFAGMVTNVEHRVTKTNKPFGSFEFEDLYTTCRFVIFNEDYLKFKHFLIRDTFLFIRGKVAERKWSQTKELEFKINSMELLAGLREKLTKRVVIDMPLPRVDESMLTNLDKMLSEKPKGPAARVEFRVLDTNRKLSIMMASRSRKIELSDESLERLSQQGMEFRLQ